MSERSKFLLLITGFLVLFFLPIQSELLRGAILSGFTLLHEYAREHVLTCLVPAFFIAGAIGVFLKKETIMRYLGPKAKRWVSYSIASVSGAALAVCSCTILPLFAGIRKRGAGLGPAITFLFSGPAINVAAIFLTMSVLGYSIGIARIIAAIIISILAGVAMQLIFRERTGSGPFITETSEGASRRSFIVLALLLAILIVNGVVPAPISYAIIATFVIAIVLISWLALPRSTVTAWMGETWSFTKLLVPYLAVGVFVAGFVMPFLPEAFITSVVGSNSLSANLLASVFGAFMYFSTLTEIPIVQALIEKGMHAGPALTLLLAGPSLSLPNLLVIYRILGARKTGVYALLVIGFSMAAGLIYGTFV